MPELPEVETIRKGLEKTIVGRTIRSVDVLMPKIISLGPATVSNLRKTSLAVVRKFRKILEGQKVVSAKRRAKMLIIYLSPHPAYRPPSPQPSPEATAGKAARGEGKKEEWRLLVHLKMTGQLIFAKKGERKVMKIFNVVGSRKLPLPHTYTRVAFNFRDGSKLYYNDLRQFGYLRLVSADELVMVRELLEYGPEPFSRDFTLKYWFDKLKQRPSATIKQFLLDPKVVAGVGNIYSDEIMYRAGVRPTRRLKSLNLSEKQKLFKCVPLILREGLRHGGSSVGDYFSVDGSEGTYGRVHRVYGRGGEKCRRCQSVIKTVKLGGRTSSFCIKCQH